MLATLLADKRVLMLLDDAENAGQVEPLLPGGAGCAVLITSRHRLSGLGIRGQARHIPLDPLSVDASVAFLATALDTTVDAETDRTRLARIA